MMHRTLSAACLALAALAPPGCGGPECTALNDCPAAQVCTVEGVCVATDRELMHSSNVRPAMGAPEQDLPLEEIERVGLRMTGTFGPLGAIDEDAVLTSAPGGTVNVLVQAAPAGALVVLYGSIDLSRPGRSWVSSASLEQSGIVCTMGTDLPPELAFDEPIVDGVVEVGEPLEPTDDPAGGTPVTMTITSAAVNIVLDGVLREPGR